MVGRGGEKGWWEGGGPGGGASRRGRRLLPALGAGPECSGRVKRAGPGEGPERGCRCSCGSRGRRQCVPRGVRRAEGPTDPRAGEGRRRGSVYPVGARAARGGAAAKGRSPGEGGGRAAAAGPAPAALGVGARPLPGPVGRAASAPRQQAEPRYLFSLLFLSSPAKNKHGKVKTIAGPPGTRREPGLHTFGANEGGTGSGGPTSEPLPDCPPRSQGLLGAGARWEAERIPWSEAFGEVLQEQSGLPRIALLWAGN